VYNIIFWNHKKTVLEKQGDFLMKNKLTVKQVKKMGSFLSFLDKETRVTLAQRLAVLDDANVIADAVSDANDSIPEYVATRHNTKLGVWVNAAKTMIEDGNVTKDQFTIKMFREWFRAYCAENGIDGFDGVKWNGVVQALKRNNVVFRVAGLNRWTCTEPVSSETPVPEANTETTEPEMTEPNMTLLETTEPVTTVSENYSAPESPTAPETDAVGDPDFQH